MPLRPTPDATRFRGRCARVLASAALLAACGPEEPERAAAPASPDAPDRPNVLLVTLDTLRADHLGAYGHPEPISPAFDAFAARGVVYERALAASSRTAPSHATILTSRWVRDHSIAHFNGYSRLGSEERLAEHLRRAGYDTAAFVSNSVLASRMGLGRGFAHYDDALPQQEANRVVFERDAPHTTRAALAWLVDARAPWFLWVHYNDPHGPYTPPPPWDRGGFFSGRARGAAADAAEAPLPVLGDESGQGGVPAYQALPGLTLPRDYRRLYAAEIRHLDDWLGRLLDAAEAAAGTAEATAGPAEAAAGPALVAVVTADHGERHGAEGVYFAHGHGTAPADAHVPLVVVAPGLEPGRSRDLAHHVDVMPTILDLAGVPAPAGLEGRSLAAAWRAGEALPERVLFTDVGREIGAYRGDRYTRRREAGDGADYESFRWQADGRWQPAPPDPVLREALDAYAAREVQEQVAPIGDDDLARLRALGYVEADHAPGGASR